MKTSCWLVIYNLVTLSFQLSTGMIGFLPPQIEREGHQGDCYVGEIYAVRWRPSVATCCIGTLRRKYYYMARCNHCKALVSVFSRVLPF